MGRHKNKPIDVWERIDKKSENECWEWGGNLRNDYGIIKINQKSFSVHRLVYELTYGPISNELCVLHKCDNPKCCNPKHLKLGTHKENMMDMSDKNRKFLLSGEKHPCHKLNDIDIIEIRRKYSPYKITQGQLANEYGVSRSLISQIILYNKWKHI
jgi:hypothetical protein